MGAALGDEGTVFLGGFTTGLWGDSHAGGIDFAGVLLNLDDGAELYRWQVFELYGWPKYASVRKKARLAPSSLEDSMDI